MKSKVLSSSPFNCFHPRRLKNKVTGESVIVACGHCPACNRRRSAKYAAYCDYEALSSYAVFHVTLTFSNWFVPLAKVFNMDSAHNLFGMVDADTGEFLGSSKCDPVLVDKFVLKCNRKGYVPYLSKPILQKFLKRFRKRCDKYDKEKIRYFGIGEYGPEHFTPHFHLLLFVKSSVLQEDSGHVLGEFPRWTWSKRKDAPKDPLTPLSKLEYYIRKSWRFGRVDTQFISQGSAASYVAGYVNNAVPVPSLLKVCSCKPFCVHSRFLGREIFRKELVQVLESPFEQAFSQWMFYRGEFTNVRVPMSFLSSVYPRCKGFAYKSDESCLESYTIYAKARSYFPDKSLMEYARYIVDQFIYGYRAPVGFVETVTSYFIGSSVLDDKYLCNSSYDPDIIDKMVYNVYSELLVSSRFVENATIWHEHTGNSTYVDYYLKIKEFYKHLDMYNLNEWYRKQEIFFEAPISDIGSDSLDFFYDDLFNFPNLEYSVAFKAYKAEIARAANEAMKHKELNDRNKIFDEYGEYNVDCEYQEPPVP